MKIEIEKEISDRIGEIIEHTPSLVADLASQYSQDTFTKKAFDGNPWPEHSNPARRGSELIRSGKLRGSMTILVEPKKATISYGNDHVPYAQVHNEGFDGEVTVPAHVRRTKRGDVAVRSHTRRMRIPQRQFLGAAEELEQQLQTEIEAMVEQIMNE